MSDKQQRIVTGLKRLWVVATLGWLAFSGYIWITEPPRAEWVPFYLLMTFGTPIGAAVAGILLGWIVTGLLGKPPIKWWG